MENLAMLHKLQTGVAVDVRAIGRELQEGVYQLSRFIENKDYCDPARERWIWSIGRNMFDGRIMASTDTRFADSPNYECLWLR